MIVLLANQTFQKIHENAFFNAWEIFEYNYNNKNDIQGIDADQKIRDVNLEKNTIQSYTDGSKTTTRVGIYGPRTK